MYFEDDVPCREVSQLCSLSCQVCTVSAKPSAPPPPKFPTLPALQQHLRAEHKQHMCNICLQGRNVFIAQQLLYSQSALDKHLVSGASDAGNPLGQAGFKGHPMCRFCGSHFFDDGQLYVHMQREHFQCFLCQRAAPDSSSPVYYRNYDELEHHFRKEHCLCDHPQCLQKKFVAFASAQELQRHTALEHKSELSKDARRAALRANDLLGFVSASPVANAQAMPMPRGRGTRSGLANQAVAQLGVSAEQLARLRAQAQAEAAAAEAAARSRATLIDVSAPTPAETYGMPRSASSNEMSTGPTLGSAARWATAPTVGQGGGMLASSNEDSFPSLQRSSSSTSLHGASAAGSSAQQRQQASKAGRSMADFLGGEGRGAPGVRVVANLPPPPPPAVPATAEAALAANAALARRIQGMLPLVTREEDFALFRSLSARFRGGQLSAWLYYDHISAMGLGACVPELAALLPDASKRQELLAAAASRSASSSTGGGVPRRPAVSAAVIAAQAPRGGVRVMTPAWTCGACSLDNAAGTDVCAACGGRRRPADGEGVSALAVALEAAMRTGGSRGTDKKQAVVQAPSLVRLAPDTPGPSRSVASAAAPAQQRVDASAFPALQSGEPGPAGRLRKTVGVQPGNQWTQGRPL